MCGRGGEDAGRGIRAVFSCRGVLGIFAGASPRKAEAGFLNGFPNRDQVFRGGGCASGIRPRRNLGNRKGA